MTWRRAVITDRHPPGELDGAIPCRFHHFATVRPPRQRFFYAARRFPRPSSSDCPGYRLKQVGRERNTIRSSRSWRGGGVVKRQGPLGPQERSTNVVSSKALAMNDPSRGQWYQPIRQVASLPGHRLLFERAADEHDANQTPGRRVGGQERFVGLGHLLPVERALQLLPAAPLSGALGQADVFLAILARPAAPPLPLGHDHAPQRRILAQPTHHGRPRCQGALEEGALRVAPVDHDPDLFSGRLEQRSNPLDQPRRQLQLGGKPPAAAAGDRRFAAHIQQRTQWQADHAPARMTQDQREGDPGTAAQRWSMAIEILLVGRARHRIVMDVGSFDMRPVTPRGRIVQGQQHPHRQRQLAQNDEHQLRRHLFGLASEAGQKVIIVLVVVADAGGSQSGCHGPSSLRKEHAQHQHRQPPSAAAVQAAGQSLAPLRPLGRTRPTKLVFGHPWLSRCAVCLVTTA
jgi:hypothetical protein